MKNEKLEGQKTIEDDIPQEKDSLTQNDIKVIKEKLVNQFNSALLEMAEDVIKSPPTANTIYSICSRLSEISALGGRINGTISSLNSLKFD